MCQSSGRSMADYTEKHVNLRVLINIKNWKNCNAYELLIYSPKNSSFY